MSLCHCQSFLLTRQRTPLRDGRLVLSAKIDVSRSLSATKQWHPDILYCTVSFTFLINPKVFLGDCTLFQAREKAMKLYNSNSTRPYWFTSQTTGGYKKGQRGPLPRNCFAKTDFRTNWPTPQVVIMQKGVQLHRALTPDQGLCPCTPLGALQPDSRYRFELRAHRVEWTLPNCGPGSPSVANVGTTVFDHG